MLTRPVTETAGTGTIAKTERFNKIK